MDKILIETHNYKKIFNVCFDAILNHKMLAIIGDTGWGKTTALTEFLAKFTNNVFYIEVDRQDSVIDFYLEILNQVTGEYNTPGPNKSMLINQAAKSLSFKGKNQLLIIDQANKLTAQMLEILHSFRDMTKSNTGIILSGTLEFRKDLLRWRKRGITGIPEFIDRINAFRDLLPPDEDEIISIIRAYGINDTEFEEKCLTVVSFRTLENKIEDYLSGKEGKDLAEEFSKVYKE